MKTTKILDSKMSIKIFEVYINCLIRRACHDNIININQDIDNNFLFVIKEEGCTSQRGCKTKTMKL
jgi:hypothetical protein